MSTAGPIVSPDDLLTMPDGESFELVDGQLMEKQMGAKAVWVGARIITRLGRFIEEHDLGHLFQDGVQLRCYSDDPDRIRKPDACYVRRGRFAPDEPPEGFITIAPDLVVEVVSPNDLYYEVDRKVEEYLDAGVQLVWVINPDTRSVQVYVPGSGVMRLDDRQELTGGNVLPGFACRVGELFPAIPAT